jgi:anti-sigma B factor antagonist
MIQFTCTHCQTRLNVPDDKAGHSGKCPKCGRTIQVPSAAAAAKGHAPLMPPPKAVQRVEDGEIPLADEPPRGRAAEPAPQQRPSRAAGGLVITPAHTREGGEDGEIPLADEPPRNRPAEPARQQRPSRAAGGLVITPAHASEGGEDREIPLADEPGEKAKETPPAPEPPPTPGGLVITPDGDALVVSFQNTKILDAAVIETIGQELYALVDERACRKIVLDFSHVKFLSSQMVGVLILLHQKVAGIKGRLLLCAVNSDLQKLFQLVRLDRVLPIMPDRHTALGVLSLS